MGCRRHLSFRRRVRRDGPSLAGHDSRLRRPRLVSAFPMALHLCTDFSSRRLCSIFPLGPQRNRAGGFYVGRVAWHDANIRVLPHLRCESRIVCRDNASARFCPVWNMVRNCCASFAAADDRHAGNILFRGRPIHSPDTSASRAAGIACAGASGFSSIFGEFYLDVEQRETAEPGETRASRHEHFVLVVLQ